MAWMKESLTLDSDEPNKYNVTLMPSNTERDDALSDNAQDRDRVGGGSIGSQKEGSANATDASYFVPLECLAAGWNGKDGDVLLDMRVFLFRRSICHAFEHREYVLGEYDVQ